MQTEFLEIIYIMPRESEINLLGGESFIHARRVDVAELETIGVKVKKFTVTNRKNDIISTR